MWWEQFMGNMCKVIHTHLHVQVKTGRSMYTILVDRVFFALMTSWRVVTSHGTQTCGTYGHWRTHCRYSPECLRWLSRHQTRSVTYPLCRSRHFVGPQYVWPSLPLSGPWWRGFRQTSRYQRHHFGDFEVRSGVGRQTPFRTTYFYVFAGYPDALSASTGCPLASPLCFPGRPPGG